MLISLLGTFIVYFLSVVFLKSILDVGFVLEGYVWAKIIVITIASWAPFYLFKKIKSWLFPDQIERLRKYQFDNSSSKKIDSVSDTKQIAILE